jgi:hypothetical protein
MQKKVLAAACAAALASFAGTAAAQVVNPFDVPQIRVFVSGASAPQATLGAIATSIFETGFHTFWDNGNSFGASTTDDGRLYRSYFGRIKADASIPASLHGKTARIENRAQGGSVFGVNPVARAQPIENMPISAAVCPTIVGNIYRCAAPAAGTNLEVPDAGVSDIAPKFFLDPLNVESGATQLTTAEAARLRVQALQGLAMGIVATNAVPNTTVFTRQNYLGLLSGSYGSWDQIDAALPAQGVVVCRRVNGSGTQASYNWFFNNFPCGIGVTTGTSTAANPLTMPDSSGGLAINDGTVANPDILTYDAAGITIVENSSSGQVRGCLQAANNGGVHNFTDGAGRNVRVTFPAGGGVLAIGNLSLDSAGNENGWTFRTLGGAGTVNVVTQTTSAGATGVAPLKTNLKSGAYEFVSEVTGQYRFVNTPRFDNNTIIIPALSGDKLTLTQEFFDRLADAATLNGISSVGTRNANIALPSPINSPTDAVIGFNVANGSRGGLDAATSRPAGNICAPIVPFL